MDLISKKELFDKFLVEWGDQFKVVPAILKYLTSYPEIESKFKNFVPLEGNDIHNSQFEWVSLVAQLDNPIETTFFKEYWIPINKYRYDYFIDVSSSNLTLFEVNFFGFEPYRWYKKYIYKDLSQFLIDIDSSNFSFDQYFKDLEDSLRSEEDDLWEERKNLGLSGNVKLYPIDSYELFEYNEFNNYLFENNSITFYNVKSEIVSILPHECIIKLKNFKAPYSEKRDIIKKVKNIKGLLYLIQSSGSSSIDSYSIQFDTNKLCKCIYKNNTFKITHNDKEFLKAIIKNYEIHKKQ